MPDARAQDEALQWAELRAHIRMDRAGAAMIWGGFFGAALLIAALLPPRYDATATLAVLPAPEFTVREDAGSHAMSTTGLAMDQVMKAETAILESPSLHDGTLQALGIATLYPDLDPLSQRSVLHQVVHGIAAVVLAPWRVTSANRAAALHEAALDNFASDLTVLPAKDANVITVTYHHRDGALAALAVNTMLARYAERRSTLYDDPQLAVVRRQTQEAAQQVREADAALASFKAAHVISDFAGERDLLLHRQSDTAQQLGEAASNAAEQQARLEALSSQIERLQRSVPLYNEADTDTRLQPIDAALVDLRGKLATAELHYRDTSRTVTDLRATIAAREAERSRLKADPAPSLARAGRSLALDPLLVDRAHAAAETAAAAARAGALRAQLASVAEALARLAADETTLADLTRRSAAASDNFTSASRVQSEQRMTEAEDSLRLANVRVIQPALVPQRPAPIPLLVVMAGFMLGGFAASAWVIGRFALRPTFLTPEGLAAATGLPVLAVFPVRERESVG